MKCPVCGAEMESGFLYCVQCGAAAPEPGGEGLINPFRVHDIPGAVEGIDITSGGDISIPEIKPFQANAGSNSDPDSEALVFCPNCGPILQKNTDRCSKCGMILGNRKNGEPLYDKSAINSESPTGSEPPSWSENLPQSKGSLDAKTDGIPELKSGREKRQRRESESSVPLFAPTSGRGYVSDPFGQSGITQSDLDDLSRQFASFSASAVPPIASAPETETPSTAPKEKREDPPTEKSKGIMSKLKSGKTKKRRRAEYKEPEVQVEDFTMKTQMSKAEHVKLSNYEIPIIEGADLDEDAARDEDISGYAFTENSMDDISFEDDDDEYDDEEESAVPEPINLVIKEPEPIKPTFVEPDPLHPMFPGAEPERNQFAFTETVSSSIPELEPIKRASAPETAKSAASKTDFSEPIGIPETAKPVPSKMDFSEPVGIPETAKSVPPYEPEFIPEEIGVIPETPSIAEVTTSYEPPKEIPSYKPPKEVPGYKNPAEEVSSYKPPEEAPSYKHPEEVSNYKKPPEEPANIGTFTPLNSGSGKRKKLLIVCAAAVAVAAAVILGVNIAGSANNKPPVIAEKPSGTMSSDKTVSLDKDRQRIMTSAAEIAGEVGKADILAQQVIRIADASEPQNADMNAVEFYNLESTKVMLEQVKDSARVVGTAVSKCSPKNDEYVPQYMVLTDLKKRYDIIAELVKSPAGRVSGFKENYETAVQNFNSELNLLGFSVFINSDYTDEDKKNAYYSSLCDAQDCALTAQSGLSALRSSFHEISNDKFTDEYYNVLFSGGFSEVKTAAAQTEAYSVMLSSAPADYEEYGRILAGTADAINSAADLYNASYDSDSDTLYSKGGAEIAKISDENKELKKFTE